MNYTDHAENRRDLYHQLARATQELRTLIRIAGPEGIEFARTALQTAINMEREATVIRIEAIPRAS